MSRPTPHARTEVAGPRSRGRTVWRDVAESDWCDWHWQMRHRLRTTGALDEALSLSPHERSVVDAAMARFRMSITPYYASLIDPDDPDCPIRRQAIPSALEMSLGAFDIVDPLNEEGDAVAPGMTHRYPDRVLWVVSQDCAVLCRHCTRKRKVGGALRVIDDDAITAGIAYLRSHQEVRDVLLSGGDPLLLSDDRLADLLGRIRREAPSVEIIRIGTRLPVTLPQRITPELVATLARFHPVWLNTHFNVPQEMTPQARAALARLADAGIPLGNQTVLLKGVNDCWALMRELMRRLTANRVRPYYIYQCDLAQGLEHFRTTVAKGIEIMEHLRGHLSGLAVPTFVIDAPGGGGKIPVAPNYVVSQHEHKVVLRNFEGRIVAYEEPRDYTGMCTEGRPCRFCREERASPGSPAGVAGLFDDDPTHISLVPTETAGGAA